MSELSGQRVELLHVPSARGSPTPAPGTLPTVVEDPRKRAARTRTGGEGERRRGGLLDEKYPPSAARPATAEVAELSSARGTPCSPLRASFGHGQPGFDWDAVPAATGEPAHR